MKVLHTESVTPIPLYASVLKSRRERLGFKQEEVASRMGVSTMALSYFERGERIPKLGQLERWANALQAEVRIEITDL